MYLFCVDMHLGISPTLLPIFGAYICTSLTQCVCGVVDGRGVRKNIFLKEMATLKYIFLKFLCFHNYYSQ